MTENATPKPPREIIAWTVRRLTEADPEWHYFAGADVIIDALAEAGYRIERTTVVQAVEQLLTYIDRHKADFIEGGRYTAGLRDHARAVAATITATGGET